MNKCVFSGRTTKDPELRYSQDGQLAVARFSLAVEDGYGEKKSTSFFQLTAFGKRAESLAKYALQGTKILVECRAKQDKWKDKDGSNRTATGFIVDNWEFAQSKADGGTGSPTQNSDAGTAAVNPMTDPDGFMAIPDGIDEELPFN